MSRTVKGSTSGVQSPAKALIIPLRQSILIDCVSAKSPIRCPPEVLLRCRVAKCTCPVFSIMWCLNTEASFIVPTSRVTSRDWMPQYLRAAPRSLSSVPLYCEQTKRLFRLSFSIVSYLLLWNLVDWYLLSFIVVCNRPDGLMLITVSSLIIDY